jgi:hypothetical protein
MRLVCKAFSNGDREIKRIEGDSVEYLEGRPPKRPQRIRRIIADVDLACGDDRKSREELSRILERLRDVVISPQTEHHQRARSA